MELVSSWHYLRNTDAVKEAVYRVAEGNPEAVIIVGAYRPAARSIELLRNRLGEDTIFIAVSFMGSNVLAEQLGDSGEGVYVTQVVPLPSDETVPVVASYHAALGPSTPTRFRDSYRWKDTWQDAWPWLVWRRAVPMSAGNAS